MKNSKKQSGNVKDFIKEANASLKNDFKKKVKAHKSGDYTQENPPISI